MSDNGQYVKVGVRIRAEWLETYPTCLAGAQLKLGARLRSVVGIITDIRGDAPNAADYTQISVYVKPDDSDMAVIVRPNWIKKVYE